MNIASAQNNGFYGYYASGAEGSVAEEAVGVNGNPATPADASENPEQLMNDIYVLYDKLPPEVAAKMVQPLPNTDIKDLIALKDLALGAERAEGAKQNQQGLGDGIALLLGNKPFMQLGSAYNVSEGDFMNLQHGISNGFLPARELAVSSGNSGLRLG